MIKLIRRPRRPRIRLTRPNKTPKSKSSLIRLEKKGSQRVAKDDMRGRAVALLPQLKLIPRPKRAKKMMQGSQEAYPLGQLFKL